MTPELIISIISASTALIAVIVSPFISYKIAIKQISTQKDIANSDRSSSVEIADKERYANTVYNFKMKKLDNLIATLAELEECIVRHGLIAAKRMHIPHLVDQADTELLSKLYGEILFLKSKINLILNPDSQHTENLTSKLQNFVDFVIDVPQSNAGEEIKKGYAIKTGDAKREFLQLAKDYLKSEEQNIERKLY